MPTPRRRITFAGFQLGDYGGMETRIAASVDLASRSGYEVSVRTARPVPDGSVTAARLADADARSVLGDWQRRPAVRATLAAGRVAASARRRRALTDAERRSVGHRMAMAEIDAYWTGPGRELLERTDLLHLFGPPLPFLVAGLQAATAAGVPSLYQSVHAVTAEYAADRWRRGFVGTCNELNLILVSHQSQADDFRRHFDYRGEFVQLGQWAYDIEDQLFTIERSRGVDDRVTIGALCRLDPVKGLGRLIEAVALLPVHVSLRIGGDGPQEAELRELCDRLGVSDRVEFVGFVEDRVAFYRSIDLFVIASLAEGGPVTGVEAMAAGLPIVSTAVGAMPDRLADGAGVIVPVDDVRALAGAIGELVATQATAPLGTLARARYHRCHSGSSQAAVLVDTWSALVDAPVGDRPAQP